MFVRVEQERKTKALKFRTRAAQTATDECARARVHRAAAAAGQRGGALTRIRHAVSIQCIRDLRSALLNVLCINDVCILVAKLYGHGRDDLRQKSWLNEGSTLGESTSVTSRRVHATATVQNTANLSCFDRRLMKITNLPYSRLHFLIFKAQPAKHRKQKGPTNGWGGG